MINWNELLSVHLLCILWHNIWYNALVLQKYVANQFLLQTYLCSLQVLGSSYLSLNKVITMDGGWYGHFRQPTADKLQHSHLSCCILHCHSVRTQTQVCTTPNNLLTFGVIQMPIDDLLWKCKRPVQPNGQKKNKRRLYMAFLIPG